MTQALAASSSLFDDFEVLEPLNQQPNTCTTTNKPLAACWTSRATPCPRNIFITITRRLSSDLP
jgi:hypothetical protein